VQQAVIDPEGDFVTLADRYGHVVVDAAHTEADLQRIAGRVRQHRVSVVLNLEGLDAEAQMRCAAAFLGGLFDADRDVWYPMLVVVDEAQLFAPAAAGEVSDEARKASLGAMTNLMCRGRKRGLAGIIATQRLAKLAKNVAAEASNFLMGRTFLDIDMARAADLLGMERRQAEMFRDLERGHFVALGPALSRRPLPIRIGPVETSTRTGAFTLVPLPEQPKEEARSLIFKAGEDEPARPAAQRRRAPPAPSTTTSWRNLARSRPPPLPEPQAEQARNPKAEARGRARCDPAGDPWPIPRRPPLRGRVCIRISCCAAASARVGGGPPNLPAFRRRLAVARAGGRHRHRRGASEMGPGALAFAGASRRTSRASTCSWPARPSKAPPARRTARSPAPAAAAPGPAPAGLVAYLETRNIVVTAGLTRRGLRILALPDLGWETAPGDPNAFEESAAAGGDPPLSR
jgi:hypothetical protein